jgi:hypothetical protein
MQLLSGIFLDYKSLSASHKILVAIVSDVLSSASIYHNNPARAISTSEFQKVIMNAPNLMGKQKRKWYLAMI